VQNVSAVMAGKVNRDARSFARLRWQSAATNKARVTQGSDGNARTHKRVALSTRRHARLDLKKLQNIGRDMTVLAEDNTVRPIVRPVSATSCCWKSHPTSNHRDG